MNRFLRGFFIDNGDECKGGVAGDETCGHALEASRFELLMLIVGLLSV